MPNFMQRQVTRKMNWIEVETSNGTEWIPGDLGIFVRNSNASEMTDDKRAEYKKAIWEYCSGEPQEWTNIQGYGARLSAPGYMDCTEWTVFDSPEEAKSYLEEYYGDDDAEESEVA